MADIATIQEITSSEELLSGIEFTPFSVDLDGFHAYQAEFEQEFQAATAKLAAFGLEKFNSPKQTKAWLEALGIDTSKGAGKETYSNPANIEAHPAEMEALAEVKHLEAVRRQIVSFEKAIAYTD